MNTLLVYIRLIKAQIASQMQYRFSFILDVVSTGFLNGLTFVSIYLVLQRFTTISGWKFWEIAMLIGTVETSFGFTDLIFSGFDPDISFVRYGTLDQLLLRPINITVQILGSRFVVRRFGRILEGLVIFFLAVAMVDVSWNWVKIIYFIVLICSQIIAFGSIFIVGSTITFWTIERIEAVNILTYGGVEMMSYPMEIFPRWLRDFFTYIIPFIFLNYLPMLFILDKPDPFYFPFFAKFLSPISAVVLLAVALAFWRFGLKHYQSTGR